MAVSSGHAPSRTPPALQHLLPLTEEERFAVADHVVSQLQQHGDPWELSEEAKPNSGPTT